jgi:hypothetical protein
MEEYGYTSTHPLGHTGPVTGSLFTVSFIMSACPFETILLLFLTLGIQLGRNINTSLILGGLKMTTIG